MNDPIWFLSLLIFLPAVAALVMAFIPKTVFNDEALKLLTLAVTIVTFGISLFLFFDGKGIDFQAGAAEMQNVFNVDWIPSFGIQYLMGMDGISFPLVILTRHS